VIARQPPVLVFPTMGVAPMDSVVARLTPVSADHQLSQIRAGRRLRCPAEIQHPGGRDHPQPADHVVEPAVACRVLPGRTGRGEAAEAGEFETLRKMAQRKALCAQQFLGLGPGDTRAELGLAGYLVEGQQLVEASQIQRHHRGEVAADRIEPADHTGATAERDDGDAVLRAIPQDLGDLVVGAGQQNRVGCILNAGVLAPQQVQRGLPASTQQAVPVVDAAILRSYDRRQRLLVPRRQLGRSQPDLVGGEFGFG
jgi:hypothetical protein